MLSLFSILISLMIEFGLIEVILLTICGEILIMIVNHKIEIFNQKYNNSE